MRAEIVFFYFTDTDSLTIYRKCSARYSIKVEIPSGNLMSLEYSPAPRVNKIMRLGILRTCKPWLSSLKTPSRSLNFILFLKCFHPQPQLITNSNIAGIFITGKSGHLHVVGMNTAVGISA